MTVEEWLRPLECIGKKVAVVLEKLGEVL